MSDQLLSMFFDEEFVPHAYLDALYSNSSQPHLKTPNKQISMSDIKLIRQRSSILLKHLDYYTKELTNDLESKIQTLYNSNSIISYSYNDFSLSGLKSEGTDSKLKPTTRLEYYVNSLSISISTLQDTIEDINFKISENVSEKSHDSTTKLLKLTNARNNLSRVAQCLETIRSIIDINPSTDTKPSSSIILAPTGSKVQQKDTIISASNFAICLDILGDTIIQQISKDSKNIDKGLVEKVKQLIELQPIFKNLSSFNNLYNNFVKRVETELKNYNIE
ncbi:hypothetical protein WICMUC_000347 [Wickerhamomyces mucosus]|uniref:Uncharacterized protein n=1 Tax=Wickerhamomyces mucosus TaxID=1378264 RepID=A0A9P8TIU7_9ASCO|nr:hypothetical protein WICMUC_000347 [Wickerhamomyces mucosus]